MCAWCNLKRTEFKSRFVCGAGKAKKRAGYSAPASVAYGGRAQRGEKSALPVGNADVKDDNNGKNKICFLRI